MNAYNSIKNTKKEIRIFKKNLKLTENSKSKCERETNIWHNFEELKQFKKMQLYYLGA